MVFFYPDFINFNTLIHLYQYRNQATYASVVWVKIYQMECTNSASDTCINVNIKATKPDEVLISHLAVQILQHLLLLQSNNSVWCVYG